MLLDRVATGVRDAVDKHILMFHALDLDQHARRRDGVGGAGEDPRCRRVDARELFDVLRRDQSEAVFLRDVFSGALLVFCSRC